MPALLTSTSTPPNAATTAATPSLTACSLVTSIAIPSAWPPAPRISPAAASAAPLSRSAIATLAPSRAYVNAISLPMPLAAPVTIAVLSLSFIGILQIGRRPRRDVPRDRRRRVEKFFSGSDPPPGCPGRRSRGASAGDWRHRGGHHPDLPPTTHAS